jgi:hypothetical protein
MVAKARVTPGNRKTFFRHESYCTIVLFLVLLLVPFSVLLVGLRAVFIAATPHVTNSESAACMSGLVTIRPASTAAISRVAPGEERNPRQSDMIFAAKGGSVVVVVVFIVEFVVFMLLALAVAGIEVDAREESIIARSKGIMASKESHNSMTYCASQFLTPSVAAIPPARAFCCCCWETRKESNATAGSTAATSLGKNLRTVLYPRTDAICHIYRDIVNTWFCASRSVLNDSIG